MSQPDGDFGVGAKAPAMRLILLRADSIDYCNP